MIPRGTAASRPDDPEKGGFEFHKWMLGDTEYDFETALNDDAILRAIWLEIIPEPVEEEKPDEQIIDKGFVDGMYLGMGAIYPDGTEICMGAVLNESDRAFFNALASAY